jgi:hypothetical protein
VNALNALVGSGRPPGHRGGRVDASWLRLRSLRLVGRVVVVLGLVLVITSKLVGEGTLYHWARSTCWLASLPVFLVLIRWWRETVFERAELARKKTTFERWLLEHRRGWKSFPAAMAGGVYLFALGSWRAFRNWVGRFETTRRILAYLFRRELHRLGEDQLGIELRVLDATSYDALGPQRQSICWIEIDGASHLDELVARLDQRQGGVVALVGERGLGQAIPVLAQQVIVHDYIAVHLKARPYVFDCKYEKPFQTDVTFRVLEAFRTHAILPPAILHRSLGAGTVAYALGTEKRGAPLA